MLILLANFTTFIYILGTLKIDWKQLDLKRIEGDLLLKYLNTRWRNGEANQRNIQKS